MKGRFNPIANIILALTAALSGGLVLLDQFIAAGICGAIGLYASLSPRLMREWERGVLLRLGRFCKILEPGITWTFPGFDRLTSTVDMRIRSTAFSAEKTLTRDTVPVNVDAVLFWVVTDAKRAVVEVEHFRAHRVDGELGGADHSARRHRPDRAGSDDLRPRGDRPRAPGDHRRQDQRLGRHGAVGGDPRRANPCRPRKTR